MKMTTIICYTCEEEVEKPEREIARKRRLGKTKFFCSRKCAAQYRTPKQLEWIRGEGNKEHLRKFHNHRGDEFTIIREHMRRISQRIDNSKKFNSTDVDLQYLKELWEKQNGKCVYTGVDLINPSTGCNKHINKNYLASVDRIDSKVGYVQGNVQFISCTMNWLKNNLGQEHIDEFFEIVRKR